MCLQHKNLLILYDAIGTLADSVGYHLNKPVSSFLLHIYYCYFSDVCILPGKVAMHVGHDRTIYCK